MKFKTTDSDKFELSVLDKKVNFSSKRFLEPLRRTQMEPKHG